MATLHGDTAFLAYADSSDRLAASTKQNQFHINYKKLKGDVLDPTRDKKLAACEAGTGASQGLILFSVTPGRRTSWLDYKQHVYQLRTTMNQNNVNKHSSSSSSSDTYFLWPTQQR